MVNQNGTYLKEYKVRRIPDLQIRAYGRLGL